MRKTKNQDDIIPLTYRIFTLQNLIIHMTFCMEMADKEHFPPELRRIIERVLETLREDWL